MRPPGAGVLYVQPDGHNPTGATMLPAIREALGRLTHAAGWVTIADETMRPLNLTEETNPSLARYNGSMLTVSSMSKIAWGGLRLGWVRAPAAITRQLRQAACIIGPGHSSLDQVVGAELLNSIPWIIQRRSRLLSENLEHLERRLRALGRPGLACHRPAGAASQYG
jgi:DNA-binding transcriptional MocR family regulator